MTARTYGVLRLLQTYSDYTIDKEEGVAVLMICDDAKKGVNDMCSAGVRRGRRREETALCTMAAEKPFRSRRRLALIQCLG